MHCFLDVIELYMLQPKVTERCDSKIIQRELSDIFKMCQSNSSYATKGYGRDPDAPREIPKMPDLKHGVSFARTLSNERRFSYRL